MVVDVVVGWAVVFLTGLVIVLTLLVLCSERSHQGKIQKKKRQRQKVRLSDPHHSGGSIRQVHQSKLHHPGSNVRQVHQLKPLYPQLHSPCSGCGEVNAKRECRYTFCATCCHAQENSVCPAHRTGYQTCVNAAKIAVSLAYTEFDISYSYLKHCPPQITSIGPQLVSLNLSNNRLQFLPKDLGQLRNLVELFVQYNQLLVLPESICLLSQLEELDAKNNHLTCLPDCIGDVKSLLILNLTNNHLSSLPSSIGALTRLEELSVHGNQLTNFPAELCSLKKLKALYAGENPLTTLPSEFGCLASLEELDLTDGHLVTLPQSLSLCQQLSRVWLTGNRLKCLPNYIGNLHRLKELHLRNNKIIYFPSSIENLNLYTFTAQANNFLTEHDARSLMNTVNCRIPPLLELCLRAVVKSCVPVKMGSVPQHLRALLSQLVPCCVCDTPTFTHRSTRVIFKTIGVFYRLPLLFCYCSHCTPSSSQCL